MAYDTQQYALKHKFGLSIEDYHAILHAQDGKCGICGTPPGKRRLAVDHCHENNTIRGLLCGKCNIGLGFFKDSIENLENAATYLARATHHA